MPLDSRPNPGPDLSWHEADSPTDSILRAYEDRSDVSSLPGSLASMMRNTTETGDIGAFSIMPHHQRTHQALSRSSSMRFNGDQLPQHQIRQLAQSKKPWMNKAPSMHHQKSERLYRQRSASNGFPSYAEHQRRHYSRGPPLTIPSGYRACSLSRGPYHGGEGAFIPVYRSDTNLRAYSTNSQSHRHRHQDQRPYSPAYTSYGRALPRDHGFSMRSRSPSVASTSIMSRNNRSTPMLPNYPNSAMPLRPGTYRQYSNETPYDPQPSRTRTPSALSTGPPRQYGPEYWPPSYRRRQPRPAASQGPDYYDYSEIFMEYSRDEARSGQEQSGFTNTPDVIEVPTQDPEVFEEGRLTGKSEENTLQQVESPSPVAAPRVVQKRLSAWEKDSTLAKLETNSSVNRETNEGEITEKKDPHVDANQGCEGVGWQDTKMAVMNRTEAQPRDNCLGIVVGQQQPSSNDGQETPMSTPLPERTSSLVPAPVLIHMPEHELQHMPNNQLSVDDSLFNNGTNRMTYRIPSFQFDSLMLLANDATDHVSPQLRGESRESTAFNDLPTRTQGLLSVSDGLAELAELVVNTRTEGNLGRMADRNSRASHIIGDRSDQEKQGDSGLHRPIGVIHNRVHESSLYTPAPDFAGSSKSSQFISNHNETVPRPDSETNPWNFMVSACGSSSEGCDARFLDKPPVPARSSSRRQPELSDVTEESATEQRTRSNLRSSDTAPLIISQHRSNPNDRIQAVKQGRLDNDATQLLAESQDQQKKSIYEMIDESYNVDEAYNWSDMTESVEELSPDSDKARNRTEENQNKEQRPKFKFKITRATNSTSRTQSQSQSQDSPTATPLSARLQEHISRARARSTGRGRLHPSQVPTVSSLASYGSAEDVELLSPLDAERRPSSVPRISLQPPSPALGLSSETSDYLVRSAAPTELERPTLKQRLSNIRSVRLKNAAREDAQEQPDTELMRSQEYSGPFQAMVTGRRKAHVRQKIKKWLRKHGIGRLWKSKERSKHERSSAISRGTDGTNPYI